MRAKGFLWALPIAASFVLVTSGCEVSTCTGEDCDFDSPFDEDGGSEEGANNGDDGGASNNDGADDGGSDDGGADDDGGGNGNGGSGVDVGTPIDLDGDGEDDGKVVDTNDDGKADGVDVDDDGEVDVPVPPQGAPTLADFCDSSVQARRAWEDKISECCLTASSAESGSDEVQAILNLFGSADGAEGCLSTFRPLVRTGKVAFNGKKAEACSEEYTALFLDPPNACPGDEGFQYWDLLGKVGKGVPAFAQMESCRAGLSGSLKKDAECTSHFECEAGLRCLAMSETRSTCQNPVPNGGECTSTAQCDADLICAGATGAGDAGRACIPNSDLKLNGGDCVASAECASGLYCEAGSCAAVPDVDLTSSGDACSESFECHGWCDSSGSKCAPLCGA